MLRLSKSAMPYRLMLFLMNLTQDYKDVTTMREISISPSVRDKMEDLENFLVNELKLSEEAALKRSRRMRCFVDSLRNAADYPLCRFRKWRALGYRCAVFEKDWIFAYEVFEGGVIVRDMSNAAFLV